MSSSRSGYKYSYRGSGFAQLCSRLWFQRSYILRHVETIEVLDQVLQKQRFTLDIDRRLLEKMGGPQRSITERTRWRKKSDRRLINRHLNMRMPLMAFDRVPFMDIDVIAPDGMPLHLSRRRSNIDFSAHIFVNIALNLPNIRASLSLQNQLYTYVTEFLLEENADTHLYETGSTEPPIPSSAWVELASFLNKQGLRSDRDLALKIASLMGTLQRRYIQCIELRNSLSDIEVLKIRTTTPMYGNFSISRTSVKESRNIGRSSRQQRVAIRP